MPTPAAASPEQPLPAETDKTQPSLPASPRPGDKPEPITICSAIGIVKHLSEAEQMQYFACEEVIDSGWATYVQVGLALATIRDERLYRYEFTTFEEYCRNRWEYGRRYVNYLISAAQVFTHLGTNGAQKPAHERQVRPLIGLTPEQAQQAWDTAVQRAGGKTVTARLLKNVVLGLRSTLVQDQQPKPKRPSSQAKRRLIDAAIGELLMLISQKANHGVLMEKVEALHGHIQSLFVKPAAKKG